MPTKITKLDKSTTKVVHEPGNMTRYVAYGVRLPSDNTVVVFPDYRVGYEFGWGHIHWGYVAEKLCGGPTLRKSDTSDVDEMTKVVAMLIGSSCTVRTGETGHWFDAKGQMERDYDYSKEVADG